MEYSDGMSAEDVERFRKHADGCHQRAQRAINPLDKEAWLLLGTIGSSWRRLQRNDKGGGPNTEPHAPLQFCNRASHFGATPLVLIEVDRKCAETSKGFVPLAPAFHKLARARQA
jgi:hypothetical protein